MLACSSPGGSHQDWRAQRQEHGQPCANWPRISTQDHRLLLFAQCCSNRANSYAGLFWQSKGELQCEHKRAALCSTARVWSRLQTATASAAAARTTAAGAASTTTSPSTTTTPTRASTSTTPAPPTSTRTGT